MSDFFSFLKTFAVCGTVFFVTMLVLLALPKSQLRSIGLQMLKYGLAAGLVILVPSPVDLLPDVVPGICHLDDIGYLIGAYAAVKSARADGKQRAFEQSCENALLAQRAGLSVVDGRAQEGSHGRA